jgi:thymidylate synthase
MEHLIKGTTISSVWAKMFNIVMTNPGKELSPVLIVLHDVNPGDSEKEDNVSEKLNEIYIKRGLNKINTVANTIFPLSLYRLARFNRENFFSNYLALVPRMKALDNRNKNGLYFERLVDFDGSGNINQLEFIIKEFTGRTGVRRSLLQASIFDPRRDHTRQAQVSFPCLQHVSFTYQGSKFYVNGFYATQQLFDKAYGNLLGLVRLGNFMSREMNLSLGGVNCYVGIEKLERITKSDPDLTSLLEITTEHLEYAENV